MSARDTETQTLRKFLAHTLTTENYYYKMLSSRAKYIHIHRLGLEISDKTEGKKEVFGDLEVSPKG